jgi:hypothetical protein
MARRCSADVVVVRTHLGATTMTESKADRVHDLIVAGFKDLGEHEPERITRMVLVKDLFFVGQRFLCGNIQAALLADEAEIKFYDGQGTLLKTVMSQEQPIKKAA